MVAQELSRERGSNNNITQPNTTQAIPPQQPLYTKSQLKESCLQTEKKEHLAKPAKATFA
jgi:hypothetical protein